MNTSLRWAKLEALMIAILPVYGITAPKFHSFKEKPISELENLS
jgi:hypothetical protein